MRNNPKVMYLEEAFNFIESLPTPAGDKIHETVYRVECGERNTQLFKKLEGSEI